MLLMFKTGVSIYIPLGTDLLPISNNLKHSSKNWIVYTPACSVMHACMHRYMYL